MDTVRMDKWLWAARFFRTRAQAAQACELGRVRSSDREAKAARDVHVGDHLRIVSEAGIFELDVLALSSVRGPAAAAQALYRETDASKAERERVAAERKAMFAAEGMPSTRPSKRDRRLIHSFRGR